MPAINPNNYNIDFFSTYSFGEITDTSYLSYLFQQNLPEIAPELINSPAGNFQDIYNTEKGLEKNINYTSISDPGSIDEWLEGVNFPVSLFDVAYQNSGQNVKTNQYGPATLQTAQIYNGQDPDLIIEDTGYLQYPTSAGGGVGLNILSEGLDAVGLGGLNSFLINFDSPLNDIAKERRLEELKERAKQNFIQETVGKINLDPLGLLAGQPLLQQDFSITKRTGLVGGTINAIGDLAGLQSPISPIPEGAFGQYGSQDTPKELLDFTGGGTRSLIYDALAINIYGPTLGNPNSTSDADPKSGVSNAIKGTNNFLKKLSSGDPAIKTTYLDPVEARTDFTEDQSDQQGRVLGAGIVNKAVSDFINGIANKKGVTKTLVPTENRPDPNGNLNPTIIDDPSIEFKGLGFDSVETSYIKEIGFDRQGSSDADLGHVLDYVTDLNHKRHITLDEYDSKPEMTSDADKWYWSETTNTKSPRNVRRGLLKYTQAMIDQQINNKQGAARFIGLPNSDKNYEKGSESGKHKEMSMGNLVKTPDGNFYCRSWSVRHGYNKYDDLIRYDALWRDSQPGIRVKGENQKATKLGEYTTLKEPGIPKIAWEKDDIVEDRITRIQSGTVNRADVIPYMFSIENLAWKDSPHYYKLPNCEKGPFGGRIMWFPPYNINFTDNTSINWDTTSFIGRAEPIYTYNNTERTGTLSFTIIVDHPSVVNKLKEEAFSTTTTNEDGEEITITANQNLETFFAGCSTEEIKQIMQSVPEIAPPEEIEEPEPIIPQKIEIPDPVAVTDSLQFHFKNARSVSKKEGAKDDGYYDRGGYQRALTSNSSCKGKIIGRCFDYNYEKETIEWYDNPRLYKGGINNYGSLGECPEGGIVINDFNEEGLVDIPAVGTTTRPLLPPCKGYGSTQSPIGEDFQPFGPNPNISQVLVGGTSTDKSKLWVKDSEGNAYKEYNYCCDLGLTGYTSGSTTITDFSKLGFYESREGANQCFWGTDTYPFSNNLGQSPTLNLPAKDYEYEFTVSEGPGGPAGTGIAQLMEFLTCTPEGKGYTIEVIGNCSNFGDPSYNQTLGDDRAKEVYKWMRKEMESMEDKKGGAPELNVSGFEEGVTLYSEKVFSEKSGKPQSNNGCKRWDIGSNGKDQAQNSGMVGDNTLTAKPGQSILTPGAYHPTDYENIGALEYRRVDIRLIANKECLKPYYDAFQKINDEQAKDLNEEVAKQVEEKKKKAQAEFEKEKEKAKKSMLNMYNECDYFMKIKKEDSFLYESLKDKLKNFHPAFHSITPEGFNSRINFLQQCGRQGPSFIDPNQPQNTAFGRPPVCILRLGDFYFTKIIIDSINFTFDPLQWDLNPEGIGVQPMLVNVDLNFKFIGGSTLQGPLTQLQNAVSYNFFANTAIYMPLEKILTKRGELGQLLTQGVTPNADFEAGTDDRTYYYGPWASQQAWEEEFNIRNNDSNNINQEEAENEETVEEFIDQNPPSPCPKSDGKPLTNEEIKALPPILTQKYPVEEYDFYRCGDVPTIYAVPKETSNPLNQVDGQNNTQNGQQDVTQQNTTNENGDKIFAETDPNLPGRVPYVGLYNTNTSGEINISGNAFRGTSQGEGSYFENGFDLLGFVPHYLYGMLNSTYDGDYQIVNNEIIGNSVGFYGFVGTTIQSGYVYDGNQGSAGTVGGAPVLAPSSQVVAFNLLFDLTGYIDFKNWQDAYQLGEDLVLPQMKDQIEEYGKLEFIIKYKVSAKPNEQGKEKGLNTEVTGDINVVGNITAEGVNKLEELLNSVIN